MHSMFTSASPPSKERDPRRAARPPVCTINGNHFLFSSKADAEKSVVRRWHAPPASADIRDCISIRKLKFKDGPTENPGRDFGGWMSETGGNIWLQFGEKSILNRK